MSNNLKQELKQLGLSDSKIKELLKRDKKPLFQLVNEKEKKGFLFNESGSIFTLSLLKIRKAFNPLYMIRLYLGGMVFAFSFEKKDNRLNA